MKMKLEYKEEPAKRDWLWYYRAEERRLKKNEKKFKGISLAKYYKGTTLKNKFGECYKISTQVKISKVKPNLDKVRQKLLLDLKIIPGISNITESNLKKQGIKSIVDLKGHYRFRYDAEKYLDHIEKNNAAKIYEHLNSRCTATNPLMLSNSTLFDLSKIAFIDIETLGLTDCPLFLIGIAFFMDEYLIIDQVFVRNLKEEKAALHFFGEHLLEKQAIGTFNGKTFDVPFIRKRMERHDLTHQVNHPHFDMKFLSQKAYKDSIDSFTLSIIESELFNVRRENDVSGDDIPHYYNKYLKSKNIASIVPIIEHNKQDLISTANIYMKLHETLDLI